MAEQVMVFGGDQYYPQGGWNDHRGTYGSVVEALAGFEKARSNDRIEWAQLVVNGELIGWWEFTYGWKGFCRCSHDEGSHSRPEPSPCLEDGCGCVALDMQPIPGVTDGS